ncbi:MAG: hypothetical protein ABSB69_11455 [Solirubrobacteraceae bacterium]
MTAILLAWAASAAILLGLAAVLGSRVRLPGEPGKMLKLWVIAILVDNRGRFSLNRLQLVAWSIVVISLVSGVFFGRLIEGVEDPLNFTIPDRVLGLLGISIGTGVTTGAVKATKKVKAEADKIAAPAAGKAASRLATYQATLKEPSFWQVFMLEEGDYADDAVDVTKFQGFAITIVLVVAYVAMAIHSIVETKVASGVMSLPNIAGTFLVLLGISYGGYIGGKLPTQTGSPRREA